ncbi:MAG: ABC transporter permease [Deltaproteobacteria bacterium]|nr:ABC transporter permease [Deltaproteobacteria bacterium]
MHDAGNLTRLYASILKETRLIVRDREALVILFVMPLAFVLIMSLAMQDAFMEKSGVFTVAILDNDNGAVGQGVIAAFSSAGYMKTTVLKDAHDEADVKKEINSGRFKFGVIIPKGATTLAKGRVQRQLNFAKDGSGNGVYVRLISDPAMRVDHSNLVASSLARALAGVENRLLWEAVASLSGMEITPEREKEIREILDGNRPFEEVKAEDATGTRTASPMPTSVQQSVPAWSLFAMFFIVIPLSVTFIKERQLGGLTRLKTMPVPSSVVMAGKAIPYFIINQLQIALMLAVGFFIVPLLGGDALSIGNSPIAVGILTISASFAAIGFGLMTAMFCKTTEQSTTFGGTSIIVFAALGGIMVPKFLMPQFMQSISVISPLSWGLDGFLDVFVRGGGVSDILPEAVGLLSFGLVCLCVAAWRFSLKPR